MNTEDEKLRTLFDKYQPELSDGSKFLERLKENLRTVDLVRGDLKSNKRNYNLAYFIAGLVGFVCGIIFMLYYDELYNGVMKLIEIPSTFTVQLAFYSKTILYGLICLFEIIVIISTFEISSTLIRYYQRSMRFKRL